MNKERGTRLKRREEIQTAKGGRKRVMSEETIVDYTILLLKFYHDNYSSLIKTVQISQTPHLNPLFQISPTFFK